MNENPKQVHPRLRDKIAAAKAGKSLRVVVKGTCSECKRRSADVPMTKTEAMNWFTSRQVPETLPQYAKVMLTTGVHRDCQGAAKAKAKAVRKDRNLSAIEACIKAAQA